VPVALGALDPLTNDAARGVMIDGSIRKSLQQLDLLEGTAQEARAQPFLLGFAIAAHRRFEQRPCWGVHWQVGTDLLRQANRVERLSDQALCAEARVIEVRGVGDARDEHHRSVAEGWVLTDLVHDVVTADFRHVDVEQNQVGLHGLDTA